LCRVPTLHNVKLSIINKDECIVLIGTCKKGYEEKRIKEWNEDFIRVLSCIIPSFAPSKKEYHIECDKMKMQMFDKSMISMEDEDIILLHNKECDRFEYYYITLNMIDLNCII